MCKQDLAMCRVDLAEARRQHEPCEEQSAQFSILRAKSEHLASALSRYLARPAAPNVNAEVGGVRGWLIRRIRGGAASPQAPVDPLVELIEQSDLFNASWYLLTYPDVADAAERPAAHYLNYGATEDRQPGPGFDTEFYCSRYPDVRESGINPLVHYLQVGRSEGRLPVPPDAGWIEGVPEA